MYRYIDIGHYTAMALNDSNKKWYLYDDAKVVPISEVEVQHPNAYILFYKKMIHK